MRKSRWFLFFLGVLCIGGVFSITPTSWLAEPLQPARAHAQVGYNFLDLTYIRRVTWLCNENYVERKQIRPKKMFREAVKRIQMLVPAIMVRFVTGHKEKLEIHVDRKVKRFTLRRFQTIFDVGHQLKPIFAFIQKHYKGNIKLRKIEFAAIHGMLKTLDTHTNFLPPSYYKDMQIHTRGEFGGLGIVIQNRDGFLTVVSPMPGTPASKVGLRPLDRIVRIGDESTINMSLTDAVGKLRGKPGSKVIIWIMRKGFTQPRKFTIIRAIIKVESVTHHLLKNKIGYVRIKNFQQNTTPDLHKALRKMNTKTSGLRGLIIDLRDNPGGLLDQAIKVSDTFLRKGVIVTHAGGSSQHKVHRASSYGTQPDYPIIILVNNGSASASEIVAGALKNNERAIVLGQRTYGKGTVQVLYPISRLSSYTREFSALKLTVAQYLTPGGISIQKIGVSPDIDLKPVHIEKDNIHFIGNKHKNGVAKKKLPKYLKGVREHRKPLFRISYFDTLTQKEKLKRYENQYTNKKLDMDFEIDLAHKLLRNTKHSMRKSFYKDAESELLSIRKKERKKILKAIKSLGVSWSPLAKKKGTPKLVVSYRLLPSKAKKKKGKKPAFKNKSPRGLRVWAGSSFRLQVTVTNKGTGTAYRVRGVTDSKYWFLNRKEFIFGKIAPKRSRKWSVHVKLPNWLNTQVHQLKLKLRAEDNIEQSESITLYCHGHKKPRFAFSYAIEERKGNGDQLLQAGESISLRVSVRNIGKGKAPKVLGVLRNKTGRELFIERGRFRFGTLNPGESTTGRFRFRLKSDILKKNLDIRLTIFDAELLTSSVEHLKLRLYHSGLRPKRLKAKAMRVQGRTAWVYGGASFDAPRVARLSKGSSLKVTGRLGPFYRILFRAPTKELDAKKKRKKSGKWTGWIYAKDVAVGKRGRRQKLQFHWQFKTPKIVVKASKKPIWSKSKTYTLKGMINNNTSLRDVYILVNGEKVYYHTMRNRPQLPIKLKIKLKNGQNRILIRARETEKFSGVEELMVYYSKEGVIVKPNGRFAKRRPTKRRPTKRR